MVPKSGSKPSLMPHLLSLQFYKYSILSMTALAESRNSLKACLSWCEL